MSDRRDSTESSLSPTPPPAKIYRYHQIKSVEHLYLSTKCADVYFTFAVNDGAAVRIPAHTNLLGLDSDVFERIFYGESKKTGDIHVTDVTEAAFKEFLQFFYLSEVKLSIEFIADIIHLGKKYQVQSCVDACAKFIKQYLTDKNVCATLSLAILFDQLELVKICELHIILNTAAVFKTVGFVECSKRVLGHILKMNILSCSEVEVFEACMSWVRAKSKQNAVTMELVETHLGKLYHDIRFASMTIQQFCKLSIDYRAVLSKDYETITKMIVMPDANLVTLLNTKPRRAKWNADAIVKCDRAMGEDQVPVNLNAKSFTTFSTNQPLLLGEFVCEKIGVAHADTPDTPNLRNVRSSFLVDVEITESSDLNDTFVNQLVAMKAEFQSKETNVLLSHPILIRPGFFYTISIGQFLDDHCYYSKELKTEVQLQEHDTTITFHNCDISNVHKVRGLVSMLNFNEI